MKSSVTLKDIAKRTNTSINTVSKALRNHPQVSEKKRAEILQVANEMAYIPNSAAQFLRTQKTNLIGLIIPDNSNPYYIASIKIIQEIFMPCGYYVIIFDSNENLENELAIIKILCSLNVAGVLFNPALGNEYSANILQKHGIPYVIMNTFYDENTDNYVIADNEQAGYLATKHLLSRNQGELLFLNYIPTTSSQDRRAGCDRALQEFCKEDSGWYIQNCVNKLHSYTSMNNFLDEHKPPFTVACFSDFLAYGVLFSLQEHKIRIPEEVAVMGIDNSDEMLNHFYGLSTVNIPIREISEQSAYLLLDLIDQKEKNIQLPPKQIVLQPSLVIRRTA